MKTRHLLLIAVSFFSFSTLAQAKEKMTASVQIESGGAAPQRELAKWLKPGTVYRFNIFGGARVNLSFIGAVGIGWDITYSEHEIKNDPDGHYKRYTWDWFAIPVSIGWLQITPGLNWVVTDVSYPAQDVREISVRPAGSLTLGLHIPIHSNVAVTVDARGEMTVADNEQTNTAGELNITGDFVSAMAGVKIFF